MALLLKSWVDLKYNGQGGLTEVQFPKLVDSEPLEEADTPRKLGQILDTCALGLPLHQGDCDEAVTQIKVKESHRFVDLAELCMGRSKIAPMALVFFSAPPKFKKPGPLVAGALTTRGGQNGSCGVVARGAITPYWDITIDNYLCHLSIDDVTATGRRGEVAIAWQVSDIFKTVRNAEEHERKRLELEDIGTHLD